MLGFDRNNTIALLMMIALLAVLPAFFYPFFLMKFLCFAIFACAFNLLLGYVGLLSFGHAAYFGFSAYIAGYSAKYFGFTPELSILASVGVAALLGLVFGWLAIRRQGIYFAMITMAFGQMVYFYCLQATFVNGEEGIQQIPRGRLFGLIPLDNDHVAYAFVAVVFVCTFVLIHRIIHSPFGQILKATRDNEARANSLGYPTERFKLIAFVLSAALAGLAGGTKAIAMGIATLTDVHFSMSGEVVLMVVVGGLGTLFGPVVGAFSIALMENYLAVLGPLVLVMQGVVFVLCVLLMRRGIVGEIAALLKVKL
jgi:branched-chain amino acid transport system permease protein